MANLFSSFSSILQSAWSIVLAFVVLMIMILIHETGHYTAGSLLGFQINEFAIGMGPKILSKKRKNGQVVSLRLLPLGGFCAFEGEDDENTNPKAFNNQKPWKRLIVLFSGAFFNFVSAVLIAVIVFSAYGETVAVVNNVYEYAPVQNQQLVSEDIIYQINGKKVFILDDISRYMSDGEMSFVVLRKDEKGNYQKVTLNGLQKQSFVSANIVAVDGEYLCDGRPLQVGDTIVKINGNDICKYGDIERAVTNASHDILTVTVATQDGNCNYLLDKSLFFNNKLGVAEQPYNGIGMSIYYAKHNFGFGQSLVRCLPFCGETAMLVLRTLGGLITGVVGVDQVGGPISTISMTSQVVSTGFANVLVLMVLVSVNLAVFNLLPVPALDGCRMVFVLIEWIAKKPINRKIEGYVNGIGLVLLLAFVVIIDLLKL